MAIEKTTKYKVFKKYQSLDNGVTWVVVEPEEAEYVAWEQNSIDCGYIPPITGGTTGGTGTTTGSTTGDTGTTIERCQTRASYYLPGEIHRRPGEEYYNIIGELNHNSIRDIDYRKVVNIGYCVTSIASRTFYKCRGICLLGIADSVTSIGDYAISDCAYLTNISFGGTISQWNSIAKGSNYISDVPATVVHCIDGDVAIE